MIIRNNIKRDYTKLKKSIETFGETIQVGDINSKTYMINTPCTKPDYDNDKLVGCNSIWYFSNSINDLFLYFSQYYDQCVFYYSVFQTLEKYDEWMNDLASVRLRKLAKRCMNEKIKESLLSQQRCSINFERKYSDDALSFDYLKRFLITTSANLRRVDLNTEFNCRVYKGYKKAIKCLSIDENDVDDIDEYFRMERSK